MYRFVGTDLYVQTHEYMLARSGTSAIANSQFEGLPKKADFSIQFMTKVTSFGQLVWGIPLEASVHICIRLCISTAFNAQRNTEKHFSMDSTTEIKTKACSAYRLVGTDLCTSLCVQICMYRLVCRGS